MVQVILFWSSCSLSYLVPWWEGQDGLLWELPKPWCSFVTPGHSVGLLRHYFTRSHLDLGMGVPLWETREVSDRVHSRVLLQHAWHWYLCTLLCYHIPRYMYRSYSKSYIWGTPNLISEVLHIPKVAQPNYLGCECLWTVSRDELISHFVRLLIYRVVS